LAAAREWYLVCLDHHRLEPNSQRAEVFLAGQWYCYFRCLFRAVGPLVHQLLLSVRLFAVPNQMGLGMVQEAPRQMQLRLTRPLPL
jgi:hypothetical protein